MHNWCINYLKNILGLLAYVKVRSTGVMWANTASLRSAYRAKISFVIKQRLQLAYASYDEFLWTCSWIQWKLSKVRPAKSWDCTDLITNTFDSPHTLTKVMHMHVILEKSNLLHPPTMRYLWFMLISGSSVFGALAYRPNKVILEAYFAHSCMYSSCIL